MKKNTKIKIYQKFVDMSADLAEEYFDGDLREAIFYVNKLTTFIIKELDKED